MNPPPTPLVETAPAKINFSLEIRGRRRDGYHELESLIVFARVGDRLCLFPGAGLALDLHGPFAPALAAGADNLVLRAARLLQSRFPEAVGRGAALHLTKRTPHGLRGKCHRSR